MRLHFWPTAEGETSVAADVSVGGEPCAELRLLVTRRSSSR